METGNESSNGKSSGAASPGGTDALTFERLFKQAHELIEGRKYQPARRTLQDILRQFPNLSSHGKSQILALSGKVAYWLGQYHSAKQDLNFALQLNSRNDIAHLVLGKIALAEYFFTKARGHFLSVERPNAEADLAMARLFIKLRDIPKAKEYLQTASYNISPTHPEYRLLSLYLAVLQGTNKFPVSEAHSLQEEFEKDPDGLILLAEIFVTVGDYSSAKSILDDVRSVCPENDQICGLLAQCAYGKQDYAAAESDANHALQLNPMNAFAMTVLLKISTRRGQYPQAEAFGRKILAQSPEYTLAHANLGDVYFLMGRYDLARGEYNAADEFTKTETRGSQLRRARLSIMGGDYSSARTFLESLVNMQGGMFYDDAVGDLLLVYSASGEEEKKIELAERIEIRKAYYHRLDEMVRRVRENRPIEKM